jgi:predicted nucleotide-binding protein (sugar kinase/HSP70/actin superfamily)
MAQENLYGYWGVSQLTDWESRLLKFLNFIAKEDLAKKGLLVEFESFQSLKDASLMNQVHKALETAITNL